MGRFDSQISRVDKCRLTRVGNMTNFMYGASCAKTKDTILICFSMDEQKQCYKESFDD